MVKQEELLLCARSLNILVDASIIGEPAKPAAFTINQNKPNQTAPYISLPSLSKVFVKQKPATSTSTTLPPSDTVVNISTAKDSSNTIVVSLCQPLDQVTTTTITTTTTSTVPAVTQVYATIDYESTETGKADSFIPWTGSESIVEQEVSDTARGEKRPHLEEPETKETSSQSTHESRSGRRRRRSNEYESDSDDARFTVKEGWLRR